MVEVLDTTLVL